MSKRKGVDLRPTLGNKRSDLQKRVSEVAYLNMQDEEDEEDNSKSAKTIAGRTSSSSSSSKTVVAGPSGGASKPPVGVEGALANQGARCNQDPDPLSDRASGNELHFVSSGVDGYDELGSRSDSIRRLTSDSDNGNFISAKVTKNLVWAVLASALGSSFQHGYNGGVLNTPEKLIGQFINETYQQRHGQVASDAQIDLIFSIIVSIFCIGGCIGALMTAIVADRLGRKEGLFYNNVLVLIACPIMASAKSLSSYELLIIGRLLIGINAGLNAGLAPLYLNEISPVNLRGALGTIYQLVITSSIFLSNIFGLPEIFGTNELWPFLFIIPLLPAAFMLTALPHCYESPKHLLLNQGRELQAQQALAWFRQTGEIQDEMDELRAENERNKMSPAVTLMDMLNQESLRKPLTISVLIMLSQQLSGINAVLFFSTSIFRSAGLSEQAAINTTLGMSLVNVLMTIVSLFLVDRAGRKTLHMTGLMGMAVTCIILALCLGPSETVPTGRTSSMIAVVSVYMFIIMFASGPGSIPWFLVAELFPSNARPLASSIAVSVNWMANFTVSLCFLPISNYLHGYTFFLFAALLIIFYLFTYYKVPETKGATAEEISALFKP